MLKEENKLIIGDNKSKRAQVTLFIILAIVIVAIGVLVYFFFPGIQNVFGLTPTTPQGFIQNCLEDPISEAIEAVSLQGGSLNPELFYLYQGNKIQYACYTAENYLPCVVQQPLMKSHIEGEIKRAIQGKTQECFSDFQNEFSSRGYTVQLSQGDFRVELLPKRVVVTFDRSVNLIRGEDVQRENEFRVILNNNLYELVSIANSIINWESEYGDAETTVYMSYYKDLKAEKFKQTDGTTIYILTDRNNGSVFQFASRSVAWPPGYNL